MSAEQSLAATEQAISKQTKFGSAVNGFLEQLEGVLSGGIRFAQLELHVLTWPHPISHGYSSIVRVHTDQVANQKCPLYGVGAIGVDLQILLSMPRNNE